MLVVEIERFAHEPPVCCKPVDAICEASDSVEDVTGGEGEELHGYSVELMVCW